MCHFHIVNNIPSLDDFLWGIGGQNPSSLYEISLGVEGYTDSLKGLAALPLVHVFNYLYNLFIVKRLKP